MKPSRVSHAVDSLSCNEGPRFQHTIYGTSGATPIRVMLWPIPNTSLPFDASIRSHLCPLNEIGGGNSMTAYFPGFFS
jgi:hypothetical protein